MGVLGNPEDVQPPLVDILQVLEKTRREFVKAIISCLVDVALDLGHKQASVHQ